MKNFITILAVCLTGIVLVGCGNEKEDYTEETSTTIESTVESSITTETSTITSTTTSTTEAITTTESSTTEPITTTKNFTTVDTKITTTGTNPTKKVETTSTKTLAIAKTQDNNQDEKEIIITDTTPAQEDSKETVETTTTTIQTTTETTTDDFPKTGLIEIELIPAPETAPVEIKETVGESLGIEKIGRFRITGYTGDTMTASGKVPKTSHTIAMNNAQRKELGLSYGQEIYISGDTIEGIYTLEDCGCGRGVVDVFCSSESECYRITSYADIYIVVN